MTSQIIFSTIDTSYPIPGRDNDSQGFRSNFSIVKAGLETANSEISLLQANKADLVNQSTFTNETESESTTTGAVVLVGGLGVGKNLHVGGGIVSAGANVITTATTVPSLINSELVVSGTFGEQTLTLKTNLKGNRTFTTGTITIGALSNLDPSYQLYVRTTSTNQVAITAHGVGTNSKPLQLILGSPTSGTWQQFTKNDGSGGYTPIGTISLQNASPIDYIVFGGPTANSKYKFEAGKFVLESSPPTTPQDPGVPGMIAWDANYIYVCTAVDTWKRVYMQTTSTWA